MSKFLVFLVFQIGLSASALGDYFSAKVHGKEYHLFISANSSYLYKNGASHAYFLKKELWQENKRTFDVFESNHQDKSVGQIKISDMNIEEFDVDKVKGSHIKMAKLKMPVEQIVLRTQIYKNDTCSFKFIDLNDVKDIYLFREVTFLISEVMDTFKDYRCDYLHSNRATEMDPNLNQLTCENEIVHLKDRFYGVTFTCKGNMSKATDFKFKAFSVIFDKTLKARVVKSDFTDSDIAKEDDYDNFNFRLTPVGVGLYSTNLLENRIEYVKIIPYKGLKKHFTLWGKPKRYLSNFAVK